MSTQPACITSHLTSEAWFPSSKLTEENRLAIAVCERCPLRRKCAQEVLDSLNPDLRKTRRQFWPIKYGIWAGIWLSESHNMIRRTKDTTKTRLTLIAGGYE